MRFENDEDVYEGHIVTIERDGVALDPHSGVNVA